MEALGVIKVFDVLVNGGAGVGQVSEGGAVDQFGFEGAPEGLHGGVVVAVAAAAHAGEDLCGLQEGLKGATGILDSLIGMEEEAGGGLASGEGELQGIPDEEAVEGVTEGPADDFAAEAIHDGGEVSPAALGVDVGDVSDPGLVEAGQRPKGFEAVGGRSLGVAAVGGPGAEGAFGTGLEVLLAHEAGDAVFAAGEVLALEATGQAGAAIGLAALVKGPFKVLAEDVIGSRARAGQVFTPLIIAAGGNLQQAAQCAHGMLGREGFDHGIPFCDGLRGSMPRDFFRISRSWRRVSSSFFRRSFSSLRTE